MRGEGDGEELIYIAEEMAPDTGSLLSATVSLLTKSIH